MLTRDGSGRIDFWSRILGLFRTVLPLAGIVLVFRVDIQDSCARRCLSGPVANPLGIPFALVRILPAWRRSAPIFYEQCYLWGLF